MSRQSLERARYLLLTTYRRDGRPVSTPVWFASRDGVLYVWTNARTGKVKRIRANPIVSVAPCTLRGGPLGPAVEGRASIVENHDVDRLLMRKYWLAQPLVSVFTRLVRLITRRPKESVYIAITTADQT
jgi:uncharacterized protein